MMPDLFIAANHRKKKKKEMKEFFIKPENKEIIKDIKGKGPQNALAAFAIHPRSVRAEIQDKDEETILFLRRHIITNVGWMLLILGLILVPPLAFSFFSFSVVPLNFRIMGVIGWYLLTFAFAFERFLTWFFNIYIVTDERIIDINFVNILLKDVSEMKIDRIQDISSKTEGFVRSFFRYGDVFIQTAAHVPEVCFEAVPYPSSVTTVLNDLILQEEQERLEGRIK